MVRDVDWVAEYAGTRRAENSGRTGSSFISTRSPSPSERSSTSSQSTPPRLGRKYPHRLREYNSVNSSELWKWLWLDFSLPARSPVSKLIRRNMQNFSRENLLDLEGDGMVTIREEQCVGFSQMVSQVSAPLGEGSVVAAVFTLVSSAMGAGCLSLPFMLKSSGIIPGVMMLVVGALLAHLSLVVLMSCARYAEADSMAQLVAMAGGGGRGRIVDVVIAIYGIAAVLCYLMFIGDFFLGIVKSPLLNLDISRETLIVAISVFVVWPLSLPRNLSALRYVCVLSVLAICLTACAVAWKAPSYARMGNAESAQEEQWELKWWSSDPYAALQSFSIALFAFAAHTNAVPVATTLKKADGGSIWRVSLYSVCIELVFYVIMGLAGYVSFRGFTKQDFILNYRNDDMTMFIVRCIYGIVVCLGAPINLSPAASSILGLLSNGQRSKQRTQHFIVVTSIIVGCLCIALWCSKVADVIGLIGASFGSLIVLAWPAMIYRAAIFDLHPGGLARFVFRSLSLATCLGILSFAVQAFRAMSG